jgi:mannonate dehydratase
MSDDILRFAAQLGVTTIQMNSPLLPGEERWEADDIRALVTKAGEYGLALEAIENTPPQFFLKAMLGFDGAEQ